MKNIANTKISGELCVVSDVHIRSENDERYLKLCQLIENLDPSTFEYLVLNGDIFEFFLGHRKYFRNKYQKLIDGLIKIQRAGVKVFFVEGNHEFHIADLNNDIEMFCDRDLNFTMKSGKKIAITHGDLLIDDWKYKLFRTFVKSLFVKIATWIIPSFIFNEISLVLAKKSRARDAYRELDHTRLIESAQEWVENSNTDIGIFGHFHIPFLVKFLDKKIVASVSDWSKPNALILSNDQLKRLEFIDGGWISVDPIEYPKI